MKDFCLFIASVFLGLLLTGCCSICANVYIKDMDKCQTMPSFKVPVKFCITNNEKISEYCIRNYPNLFTENCKSAVPLKVSLPNPGKDYILKNIIYCDYDLFTTISALTLGLLPYIHTQERKCFFSIEILSKHISKRFTQKNLIAGNLGILASLFPTGLLFHSSNAVFSGKDWGSDHLSVEVTFNDNYLDAYSKVLLHLLSTVPREEIENYYLSHLAPTVDILK